MAVQPGGYLDRTEDDNTHNAHPAWKRGKIAGILETLAILKEIITGADNGSGTINSPEIEKVRRSVFIIREALESGKPATEALAEATKLANTLRFQKQ
tara:strand:+ start:943 stop:1236 length:294 start_codon:yes stop_codon:yes gene_type:complete